MKNLPGIMTLSLALTTSCAASPSPEKSDSPSGIYNLSAGIYVSATTSCESPPNAEIKEYSGRGISTPHTSKCIAKVISRRVSQDGTVYNVRQTCNDAGDGSGKNFSETQEVLVKNPTHFAILSEDKTVYGYCSENKLPPDLRGTGLDDF